MVAKHFNIALNMSISGTLREFQSLLQVLFQALMVAFRYVFHLIKTSVVVIGSSYNTR